MLRLSQANGYLKQIAMIGIEIRILNNSSRFNNDYCCMFSGPFLDMRVSKVIVGRDTQRCNHNWRSYEISPTLYENVNIAVNRNKVTVGPRLLIKKKNMCRVFFALVPS